MVRSLGGVGQLLVNLAARHMGRRSVARLDTKLANERTEYSRCVDLSGISVTRVHNRAIFVTGKP